MLILAAAALLRLYALRDTGIFGADEGRYILDGLSKYNELRFCLDVVAGKIGELRGGDEFLLEEALWRARDELGRVHPFSPKLGFTYLTALAMLAGGVSVMAASLVDAVAAVLSVWAVFILVRALYTERAGLMAAAMLAVSNYHLYYARNPYPQCTSGLLLIAAVWFHFRWYAAQSASAEPGVPGGPMRYLVACGALAGFSFWTHYQAAGALPCLALMHLLACARGSSLRGAAARFITGGIAMAAGFLAVMAFAESLTYPLILIFRSQGLAYPHATFFELLAPRFTAQVGVPWNLSGLVLFPFFLGLFEGPVRLGAIALLLAFGLGLFVARLARDRASLRAPAACHVAIYLFVPFAVPFLLFSLKTMQGARMFTYGLPFFAGILAVIADAAWRRMGRRRAARAAFVVAFAAAGCAGLVQTAEVLRIRSAYPDAIRFVRGQGEPAACAAWSATLRAYLIEAGMEGGSLYRYRGESDTLPRYYVTDWQELYDRRYPDATPFTPEGAVLAETFEHGFGRIFLTTEALPSYGDTFENIRWVRGLDLGRARALLVYDLEAAPPSP
ncbi:MAG: glycosyltransferase family 39 protein [Candidatus Hydrogenedentes bacterium]|nr:glycosyltransferase family 39 protein [Candidatus Hydrogenedentota bacterium]